MSNNIVINNLTNITVQHNLNKSNVNINIQNCFVLLSDISSHTNSIAYLNKLYSNGSWKPIYKYEQRKM